MIWKIELMTFGKIIRGLWTINNGQHDEGAKFLFRDGTISEQRAHSVPWRPGHDRGPSRQELITIPNSTYHSTQEEAIQTCQKYGYQYEIDKGEMAGRICELSSSIEVIDSPEGEACI